MSSDPLSPVGLLVLVGTLLTCKSLTPGNRSPCKDVYACTSLKWSHRNALFKESNLSMDWIMAESLLGFNCFILWRFLFLLSCEINYNSSYIND